MITEPAAPPVCTGALRCRECQASLTHDQRYCVQCGARRGPLPPQVAQLIGAILDGNPTGPSAPKLEPGTPLAQALVDRAAGPRGMQFTMPGPRAAAAAVIGMLGFGVIIGSLAGGTSIATLAGAPMIVLNLAPASHSTPTVVSAAGSSAPADGGSGAGGGAVAASPAATPASASPSASPASGSGGGTTTASSTGFGGLPPVKHVFMIVLSDRGLAKSFAAGASAGYLGGALRRQGELIENYYAVAGAPLANEIALISGQGPTAQTASDCPAFSRISPGEKGPRGQILGSGCVYPASTRTLAGQLTTRGETWKAYFQGVAPSSATACKVPKPGSRVPQTARSSAGYLAWRNPFVYFRSLTAGGACERDEVGLSRLANDLASAAATPTLAYIVPSPCDDGSEAPCTPGARPGLAGANRFLKTVVPEIKRSAAYHDGGLIAITFDQAPQTGPDADPSGCCGPASYPNLRRLAAPPAVPPGAMGSGSTTTAASTTGAITSTTPASSLGGGEITPTGGGGHVGLLLLSPYVKAGSIDVIDYFNHFSLLGSIEKLLGLRRLGYAGAPAIPVFGLGVFNNYSG
jgi:phosphatidylinositol-3-phosphatase